MIKQDSTKYYPIASMKEQEAADLAAALENHFDLPFALTRDGVYRYVALPREHLTEALVSRIRDFVSGYWAGKRSHNG